MEALPKAKISVSLDVDIILWIDKKVEEGVFKSRSDAIQKCVKIRVREEHGK